MGVWYDIVIGGGYMSTNLDSSKQEGANPDGVSCSMDSHRKSHHSENVKKNLVTRLNRIEGQIRGIKGLIEKDTYCDDVITQISATQSAMNSVAKILLEGHMKTCVLERLQEGDEEVIDEFMITVQKLMKK